MKLLVHSCDSRKHILAHWIRFFKRSSWAVEPVYIQGEALWSDQLIQALTLISDEYVWYTLDDYFIAEDIDWEWWEYLAVDMNMDALRVQPIVQENSLPYLFKKEGELLKQTPDSPYQNSCATSIWKREYLLNSLKPCMNPWQWETWTPEKFGNVYFVPGLPFWYTDGTKKGQYRKRGLKMITE